MEPTYPLYETDYDEVEDLRDLYIQAATRLTCSAMEAQLLKAGSTTEETTGNVLDFFESAFRRVREVAEEEEDDYLVDIEENGEDQVH